MDSMIRTFEIANNILNNNWHYTLYKHYDIVIDRDLRERMSKLDFMYIMSKKECKEYEEGWRLFQQHFFSLWD